MGSRFPSSLRPSLRTSNQLPVGVPGSQTLLPIALDPSSRPQGHLGLAPLQRMTPPRGVTGMAPQSYGSGMRPGGPSMPALNMGPGVPGPWTSMTPNSVAYSSPPGSYGGPTGGSGPPGTPLMPSPGDSTNSSENMYIMNSVGPAGSRPGFSMGMSPEGPMAGMSAMEPHPMNGSLGPAEMDSLSKDSPNSVGTPRDDSSGGSEMGGGAGGCPNPFPSESIRACGVERRPRRGRGSRGARGSRGGRGTPWPGRTGTLVLPASEEALSSWKQQISEA
ncbi:hypothetical protein JRQ81_008911 [Phrynocephalus forsythii]|uniref:Single stranded DNA binding protein 4 n=1 Tax=Phrynocephalus forsythii TaxID=171643 RepID=A0A9Q0XCY7_9SAUR|nr:hypothetical protein JRQ81_008911 [Phrynocephalus forsythii]